MRRLTSGSGRGCRYETPTVRKLPSPSTATRPMAMVSRVPARRAVRWRRGRCHGGEPLVDGFELCATRHELSALDWN
jgi:hypothetical protein